MNSRKSNVCAPMLRTLLGLGLGLALAACDNSSGNKPTDPCDPNPCLEENKTGCTDEDGQAVCACDPGYRDDGTGVCAAYDPCLEDSTCADQSRVCTASGDQAVCGDCLEGFHEDDTGACIVDEACQDDSCHGHGACDVSTGVVVCACEDGYAGDYCERCAAGFHDDGTGACVLDQQCLATSCDANGSCDDSGGVVVCTCDAGYTGDHCDGCDSGYHWDTNGNCAANEVCADGDPCGANGTCDDTSGLIECACADGYAGDLCQLCAAGWHDDGAGACVLDEQCMANTCSGHGTCEFADGLVACASCDAGYTGAHCEGCDSDYHLNPDTGLCDADEDCQAADPCGLHGTCHDDTGLIECSCAIGWDGDLCQDCAPGYHDDDGACVLDEQCLPNTCSGHGTCTFADGVVSCTECNLGYAGAWCESCNMGYHLNPATGLCDADETCDDITCSGHGACQVTGGLSECVCNAGYTGDLCEGCAAGYHDDGSGACVLDEQCLPNTCSGHGTCAFAAGLVSCTSCDEGYDGAWCQSCATGFHLNAATGLCDADVDCSGVTCSGHGSCQVTGGLPECVCNAGYTGDLCEGCAAGYHDDGSGACVLDEQCLPNTCSGHGTCAFDAGVVSCTSCDTGYTGPWCGQCDTDYHLNPATGLCDADESCTGVTCSGHGSCTLQNGLAVCVCSAGYTGADCETCALGYHLNAGLCLADETCVGVTCSGHGSCYLQGGVALCACDTGYTGADCGGCYAGYAINQITGLCEIPCDGWGPDAIRCGGMCVNGLDTQNCGGCGITCQGDEFCNWDGTTAQCVCPTGPLFDPACNGQCTNLAYDEQNCGTCGQACNPGDKCIEGFCFSEDPTECPPWDCGEQGLCCHNDCWPADVFLWDSMNCGGCNNDCAGLPCVLGACYSGDSSNCNGGAGCVGPNEVCCSDPYGSGPECLQAQDLQYTPENCGECQNTCAQNEQCNNGQCACATWDANFQDCGGVCTRVGDDEQNCGACGNACAADELCLNRTCVAGNGPTNCDGDCASGSELCCLDGGLEMCISEWDLSSEQHCGGCDACGLSESCMGGECWCPNEWMGDPSYTRCAGVCTQINLPDNCGSCGNVCTGDEQCQWFMDPMDPENSGFACQCPFPDTCGGLCTDIMNSHEHCGGCDQPCAAHEICQNGGCRVAVVINEIYYDANIVNDYEEAFIELYGVPGYDLSDMILVAYNGANDTAYGTIDLDDCGGGPCTVGPDGYFFITTPQAESHYPGMANLLATLADLQNGPDSLQLQLIDHTVVDALAYGNFGVLPHRGEGTPAVDVSAGRSLCRMGHVDTNDNAADFFDSTPSPRADCPADIGWALLQFPPSIDIQEGMPTESIYGQVWVDGITNLPGDHPLIQAQLGFGPRNGDPMMGGWQWFDASFNIDVGNNNEYALTLNNVPAGSWDYAYRFQVGDGPWIYADQTWGDGYVTSQAGKLNVMPWCIQPGFDLGSALGPVAMGTTCGQMDDIIESMCFGPVPGEDVAFMWTAPSDGMFQVQICQPGPPWECLFSFTENCDQPRMCDMMSGGCREYMDMFMAGQVVVLTLDSSDPMLCGDYTIEITQL